MASAQRASAAQINEDPDFQQRSWKWQRVGWVVMILIVAAAFLGLFGSGGLFADARVGEPDSLLWVEYNRFGRLQAETTYLRVHLGPGAAEGDRLRFWLSRRYMESAHILGVTPQPESVEAGPDRYTFIISAPNLSQPTTVTFRLEPEEFGPLRGQVGLDGKGPLSFSQFVYP